MNETSKTDAAAIAGSNMLAIGLFICNDKNGNPCRIGDKVIITEPSSRIYHRDKNAISECKPQSYEGILMLSIQNGYYLKGNNIHFQPPMQDARSTFGGTEVWQWQLI